jgi:hypothetical protein
MSMMIVAVATMCTLVIPPLQSYGRTANSRPGQKRSRIIDVGTGYQRKAPKELEPIALKLIAERYGIRIEDLEITNSSVLQFRHSNKEAYMFDLEDKSGNDYYLWLDVHGKEVDQKQLAKDDHDARSTKYGKLSEALHDYLDKAASDEKVPVFILVEMPPDTDKPKEKNTSMSSERLKNMTEEEKKQFERDEEEYDLQLRKYHIERASKYVEPVAERLRSAGAEVQTFGTSAQIYVKLRPAVIREVEKWKEIRAIDRVGTAKPALDIYRQAIGAKFMEDVRNGTNGTGMVPSFRFALVEPNGRILNQFPPSSV